MQDTLTPIQSVNSDPKRYFIKVAIPLPETAKPLHTFLKAQLILLERIRQSTFSYLIEYFNSFNGFNVTPIVTGDKNKSCSAIEIRTQEIDEEILAELLETIGLFKFEVEIKTIEPDWRDRF